MKYARAWTCAFSDVSPFSEVEREAIAKGALLLDAIEGESGADRRRDRCSSEFLPLVWNDQGLTALGPKSIPVLIEMVSSDAMLAEAIFNLLAPFFEETQLPQHLANLTMVIRDLLLACAASLPKAMKAVTRRLGGKFPAADSLRPAKQSLFAVALLGRTIFEKPWNKDSYRDHGHDDEGYAPKEEVVLRPRAELHPGAIAILNAIASHPKLFHWQVPSALRDNRLPCTPKALAAYCAAADGEEVRARSWLRQPLPDGSTIGRVLYQAISRGSEAWKKRVPDILATVGPEGTLGLLEDIFRDACSEEPSLHALQEDGSKERKLRQQRRDAIALELARHAYPTLRPKVQDLLQGLSSHGLPVLWSPRDNYSLRAKLMTAVLACVELSYRKEHGEAITKEELKLVEPLRDSPAAAALVAKLQAEGKDEGEDDSDLFDNPLFDAVSEEGPAKAKAPVACFLLDPAIHQRQVAAELDGETVQTTVFELVNTLLASVPSDEQLRAAAALTFDPSPAMVECYAHWLHVVEVLDGAGLSPREIAAVLLHGTQKVYEESGAPEVLGSYLVKAKIRELAVEVLDALLELKPGQRPKGLADWALHLLTEAGGFDPRFDGLVEMDDRSDLLRSILLAMPAERRESVFHRFLVRPGNAIHARYMLKAVSPVVDLVTSELHRKRVAVLVRHINQDDADDVAVGAQIQSGVPTVPKRDENGLTEKSREALEFMQRELSGKRLAEAFPEVAQRTYTRHLAVAGASELADESSWLRAGPERQQAIARAVEEASAGVLRFKAITTFQDLPIAEYCWTKHETILFSLVPGFSYQRGLSDAELQILERDTDDERRSAVAEIIAKQGTMRPVRQVRLGPIVVSQSTVLGGDLGQLSTSLENKSPFRLLSEAEWEGLARGGKPGELFSQGNFIPEEKHLEELQEAKKEKANRFGTYLFGNEFEICADAFRSSYDNAPDDGTPVWGKGLRVVRGGAGDLSPWQGDEWIHMLNAARFTTRDCDYLTARIAWSIGLA